MSGPWSFQEAVEQSRNAETEQRRVESEVALAYREAGRAQELYSVALARRMFELKSSGVAVTACEVLAKGDPRIAELRRERDIKEGLKETAKVAAWRTNADRRDVTALLEWAQRRDLADGSYRVPAEPVFSSAIGGRA